jgi:oligopeptide transport system ATP-binding protein
MDHQVAMAPSAAMPAAVAGSSEARPLLEITDLCMYFPIMKGTLVSRHVGDVKAVDGVTLSIKKGETVGLVGESGCGKSTVGRTILRLYEPTAGRIVVDGRDITHAGGAEMRTIRRQMQMIFQDPYASLNPRMTAAGIVSEPMEIHNFGEPRARRERVRELLATVGLDPDYGDRFPHEFSGGQRQRIGVARALALHPDLIVADEPISALDVSIQAQIINLLEHLQDQFGLTYLFIAHDLSVVRHISDRIAVMYLGRLVEVTTARALYERPLHPYTVALLSAVPIPDPTIESRRQRIILTGDVPSPSDPPPGCHFHTRCWLRARLGNPERCVVEAPELRQMASGHAVACHFAEEVDGSPEQGLQVKGTDGGASSSARPASAAAGTSAGTSAGTCGAAIPVAPPSTPHPTPPSKPARN